MKKLIIPPKITTFKKQQKGSLTSLEWKKTATTLSFGVYGIQILKSLRISLKQLEITRRLVSKYIKKTETFWFRMIPDIPVSKKPNEIRMGKGKGAVAFWALRLKAGQTLIELSFISLKKATQIYNSLAKKLPIPCVLLKQYKKIH